MPARTAVVPHGAISHGVFMAAQFRKLPGVEPYEQQPLRRKTGGSSSSGGKSGESRHAELQRNLDNLSSALTNPDFLQQTSMSGAPPIDVEFPKARLGAQEADADRVEALLRGTEEDGGENSHLLFPRIVAAIAAASSSATPQRPSAKGRREGSDLGATRGQRGVTANTDVLSAMELEVFKANEEAARAGGSNDQDRLLEEEGEGADSRPRSPIIIWRPSAQVRLATNLPPDVQRLIEQTTAPRDSAGGWRAPGRASGPPSTLAGSAADDLPSIPPPASTRRNTGRRHRAFPPVDSSFTHTERRRRPVQSYGARWYIPAEQWQAYNDGNGAQLFHGIRDEDEALKAMEAKGAELEHEIAGLFSSKMYFDYLKRNSQRVPHFLKTLADEKQPGATARA